MKYSFAAVAALHVVDGLPRPGSKVCFPEMRRWLSGRGFPGLDKDSHCDLSLLFQSNGTQRNLSWYLTTIARCNGLNMSHQKVSRFGQTR